MAISHFWFKLTSLGIGRMRQFQNLKSLEEAEIEISFQVPPELPKSEGLLLFLPKAKPKLKFGSKCTLSRINLFNKD